MKRHRTHERKVIVMSDVSTRHDKRAVASPRQEEGSKVSPMHENTFKVSPRLDKRFEVSPRLDKRFEVSPSHDNTFEISQSPDNIFEVSPSHDNIFEVSPSHDKRFEVSPSPDNTFEVSPSHDNTFEVSPSHDNTFELSASHDNTFEVSPIHDNTFEVSPSHDKRFEVSPRLDKRFDVSPRHNKRVEVSPMHHQRSVVSPRHDKRFAVSPRHDKRFAVSPRHDKRSATSPQRRLTENASGYSSIDRHGLDSTLKYVQLVRKRFADKPEVFRTFSRLLGNTSQGFDKFDIVSDVVNLFADHRDLVETFLRLFVPEVVRVDTNGGAVVLHMTEQQSVKLPSKHHTTDEVASDLFTSVGVDANRRPDACAYIRRIQRVCKSETYRMFLTLAQSYCARMSSDVDTIHRIVVLFRKHPELVVGFQKFLPPGCKIMQRDKHLYVLEYPNRGKQRNTYFMVDDNCGRWLTKNPFVRKLVTMSLVYE